MTGLPSIEAYLGVAGRRVVLEDLGPDAPSPLTQHIESLASWLTLRPIVDQLVTRTLTLRGPTPHGRIRFIGDLQHRMIEPLVLTLRALATGHVDLDTPATPAFLNELNRNVNLRLIVSTTCPFCPAAAAVVLRLACTCTSVHVDIVRHDVPGAPKVQALPTLLDDERVVRSGLLQEMDVVQAILH